MSGQQWAFDALIAVALVLGHARLLRSHQPEPEPGVPGADTKPRYAAMATWGFTAVCAAVAAICQFAGVLGRPAHRPLWIVWAAMIVLIGVDARSTWLPRRMTWICLTELGCAIGLVALLDGRVEVIIGALAGGLVLATVFWLLWRFGAGIGFGDVRLSLGMGGLAGAVSADFWFAALMSASLVGACWGVVHARLKGRSTAFAYGPALWSGPWAAQLWAGLV